MTQPMPKRTILLVEDEFLVQDMVQSALEDAGYAVTAADNGPDALAILERDGAEICGMVSDVNLGPGPDGWDVATRARELRPDLPVVFVSGDSAHEWAAHGVPNSIMICKPFAAMEVVVALATLRNGADAVASSRPAPGSGDDQP